MATSPIWIVRAGEGGTYADEFVSAGIVAIGWGEAGQVGPDASDAELEQRFLQAYPTAKEGSRRSGMSQVRRFLREPKTGDPVATYAADRRVYILGTISGGPEWREHRLARVRRVKWTHEVPRDALSAVTRNSLGSSLTLFRLDEGATADLFAKAVPIGSAPAVTHAPPATSTAGADDTESQVIHDAEKRAQEFVEDKVARLDWQQMQALVAAVLRAMGYKTRVAGEGPDHGVDIFASPDGLGLQEPRIFVEVKHRPGSPMGSQEIRAFLGGRKPGDRCLYVSTGGFTKDARYEAERSAVPLTLITLVDLRELLLDHYERLDSDARSLVPLKRIYLPQSD